VVALEVKATTAPSRDDARHLAWLRDQLGDRFLAGAVLHTGPAQFALGARIFAVPDRRDPGTAMTKSTTPLV
jgi:hypothetical protein